VVPARGEHGVCARLVVVRTVTTLLGYDEFHSEIGASYYLTNLGLV